MKKVFAIIVFLVGVSSISFAQSAGGGGSEKSSKLGSGSGGMFHKERKPRKQMSHFDTQKRDPNIKNNGTAYRRNHKREYYTVDGDGFGSAKQGGR